MFRRNFPQSRLFLWIASVSGVAAVLAMEAGWVVTEVGRQPWIVRGYMKVEEAATSNEGVWVTFVVIFALYVGVAVTLTLILRGMSRRFREAGTALETGGPYAPSELPRDATDEPVEV